MGTLPDRSGRASMGACPNSRSPDVREECWHVYYGDVRAGTIANRSGILPGENQGPMKS